MVFLFVPSKWHFNFLEIVYSIRQGNCALLFIYWSSLSGIEAESTDKNRQLKSRYRWVGSRGRKFLETVIPHLIHNYDGGNKFGFNPIKSEQSGICQILRSLKIVLLVLPWPAGSMVVQRQTQRSTEPQ